MRAKTFLTRQSQHLIPHFVEENSRFARNFQGLLSSLGIAALLSLAQSNAALAATAPSLGTTSPYGVVSSTFSNTNPTNISGSICYTTGTAPTTGAIVGPPCPAATGTDQGTALANLNGQACVSLGAAVDLSTWGTFTPGCYSSTGAMSVGSGTVTLNGPGVYIFKSGGALNTTNNTHVVVAGGACQSDVFWTPIGATTLGANTSFVGNILDGVANAVTMGNLTTVVGRVLSYGGVVTTNQNTITVPACVTYGSDGASIPTLSEWAMIMLASLLALAGFAVMRGRAR